MWEHLSTDKQIKQMCGTCKNAGRIVGYVGRGKRRKMQLSCEIHKTYVAQDFLCESYKDERGVGLYKSQ